MKKLQHTSDLLVSFQRTLVPIWAAWLVLQAARLGVDLPGSVVSDLVMSATASFYYGVVRPAEVRFPVLGVLLGSAKQPVYEAVDGEG